MKATCVYSVEGSCPPPLSGVNDAPLSEVANRPALVPTTKGLVSPTGGSGPAGSFTTKVPLMAGFRGDQVAAPSLLWNMGRVPADRGPPEAATIRIGTCTAPTAIASMLESTRPDCDHVLPSALMKTPLSVAAAMVVRLNANARTARPSRPPGTDQLVPASPLSSAPPPLVPARTSPALTGLKAIVVAMSLPLCTEVQVVPASVLLSSEPSEFPAIRSWLLVGSTARAKIAE